MVEQSCPSCGMNLSEARTLKGHTYPFDGRTYCCKGCAEGTGCTCR